MSSVLRKLVIHRVLFAWAFLAFATFPISASADQAQTGGYSAGGGAGAGNGSTVAGVGLQSSSKAESRRHKADASTDTGAFAGVAQGEVGVGNNVHIHTTAHAGARSNKAKLEAYAKATVSNSADTVEAADNAGTGTTASAEAYAASDKKGSVAYASSIDGAYAYANTSLSPVAYVPDGQTQTITKGKKTVAVAYTEQGTFSIAWTKGKTAGAMTGTTENTAALSSGNIKAAIRSATFASAEASPTKAYAFASATVNAMASNSAGYAEAYGHSEAYASVTRVGPTMRIAVATTNNIGECGPSWWLKKIKRKECVVQIRTVKVAPEKLKKVSVN